jgi:hypothetical protein
MLAAEREARRQQILRHFLRGELADQLALLIAKAFFLEVVTSGTNSRIGAFFGTKVAVAGIHTGGIESSNGTSDRSLLDFFQVAVDSAGKANIIYTAGDETNGTDLFFTKEQ